MDLNDKDVKIQGANFNAKLFRTMLAGKLGVPEGALVDVMIPQVGEKFLAFGLQWEVTYRRERPFRISCEPCGVPYEQKQEVRIEGDMRE